MMKAKRALGLLLSSGALWSAACSSSSKPTPVDGPLDAGTLPSRLELGWWEKPVSCPAGASFHDNSSDHGDLNIRRWGCRKSNTEWHGPVAEENTSRLSSGIELRGSTGRAAHGKPHGTWVWWRSVNGAPRAVYYERN